MKCDSCKHCVENGKGEFICVCGKQPEYCIEYLYDGPSEEKIGAYANKQEAKADAGKPQLTLVPRQILFDIARVREYGTKKYGDPENWRQVDRQRYRDAAFRHFCAYLDDPEGTDAESGLPHLAHLACNIAFLCEMKGADEE